MKGCGNRLGLIPFALVIGALLGFSLYLDIKNVPTPGAVVDKEETIRFAGRQTDSWSRLDTVTVQYRPDGRFAPLTGYFTVDVATYDRLAIGSPVVVRYPADPHLRDLLFLPLERLDGQTTLTVIRTALPPGTGRVAALILGAVVLGLLWTRLRARVKGLGWLLVVYLLGAATFLFVPWPGRIASGPHETALATVRSVHAVNYLSRPRSGRGRTIEALQPYDLVELQYVPEGRTDPVVGVDAVDRGSVPGLAQGATVTVSYAVDDVRTVSIEDGRRTYRQKNLLRWALALVGGVVLALVGTLVVSGLRQFFARRLAGALARAREARAGRR